MWRLILLAKMVARIVILSIALALVAQIIVQIVVAGSFLRIDPFFVIYILRAGAKFGLSLAIPMLLVTVVFFREIRRPAFYRFAMLTVALIVAIALWLAPILEGWPSRIGQDSILDKHLAISIGSSVLHVLICNIVASVYIRENQQRRLQLLLQAVDHPSKRKI